MMNSTNIPSAPMADYLANPSKIGNEISITGKWVPSRKGLFFRKSEESREMLQEWQDIHQEAKNHPGMLATEINHAIGEDAVLVHHIFSNTQSAVNYFDGTASRHAKKLLSVARPDIHLVRGLDVASPDLQSSIGDKVTASYGHYLYGYVKNDYRQPDPTKAIQVTAKWVCKDPDKLEELVYWWQRVGTDAFDLEKGLIRFEVFRALDEHALIIHETFTNSDELKFHLTKGTANRYKSDIDKIAAPANYFFRGPVSWTIRTYSRFMRLPATYSSRGSHYSVDAGTMSEGTN